MSVHGSCGDGVGDDGDVAAVAAVAAQSARAAASAVAASTAFAVRVAIIGRGAADAAVTTSAACAACATAATIAAVSVNVHADDEIADLDGYVAAVASGLPVSAGRPVFTVATLATVTGRIVAVPVVDAVGAGLANLPRCTCSAGVSACAVYSRRDYVRHLSPPPALPPLQQPLLSMSRQAE
jgi:hypothetical protein